MLRRLNNQAFTIGLIAAVVFAFWFPTHGATGGTLKTEITTKLSIALIFFFQGLSLETRKLLASATHFRLHVFCQSWIFILSPALMLLLLFVFGRWIPQALHPGLLYLSILPTTISSSTSLTASSNGDAGAALFSATFSNIAGVIVSPLWCLALFANTRGQFPAFGSMIAKIAIYILLPLVIGQIARPFLPKTIEKLQAFFKRANNALIVFVVYAAFSNSVADNLWQSFSWTSIAIALIASFIYLLLLSSLVWTSSELSDKDIRLRIAAFFCGSQKTLAAGVPMAGIIFAGQSGSTQESLIILPLMLYHALQLFLAGIVKTRLAAIVDATTPTQ